MSAKVCSFGRVLSGGYLMKSKQIILLGPPGSDVEGQAIALAKHWYVPYVSLASLFRQAIIKKSDIGEQIRPYVSEKQPVPDDLVMRLVQRRIEQPDMLDGWVMMGFPRSLAQAEAFDALLLKFERPVVEVAYFKVMTGVLINRLMAEEGAGESVAAIRERLKRCQAEVDPLIEYYRQQSRLVTINGSRSAAEVMNELSSLGEEETGAARFVRDEAELDELIAKETLLVVDCVASWCGPCKLVTPMIDRLAEEFGEASKKQRAAVVKLDFDNNRQVAKRFGLKGMPSVMFFKDGERVETLTGVKSYQDYCNVVTRLL